MYKQALEGDINTNIEFLLYKETMEKYVPYGADPKMVLPLLVFDQAQATVIGNYEPIITSYVTEMTVKFINGDADIEKEWNSYIQELKNKGLEDYLKVYQLAYDMIKTM